MPTDSNLREFAERYSAAWCSRNPASVAEFFSPDGSLTINGGNPSVGREAITRAAASFMTTFPDLQVILDHVIAENEAAEYHWILTGTNSGAEGTGNTVHITGFERWQFDKDGLARLLRRLRLSAPIGIRHAQRFRAVIRTGGRFSSLTSLDLSGNPIVLGL